MSNDTLPAAPEAEKYQLACAINWPERFGEIASRLAATDFVDPLHQRIYRTFVKQHQAGGVDPMLAASELNEAGYFLELGQLATTTAHIATEAAKIIEARRKRQLYDIAHHASTSALNGRPAESVYYELQCALSDFGREAAGPKPRDKFSLRELCKEYPTLNPPVVDGLFRAGETVNIISTSKVGKSWLAYNLALSIITGTQWLNHFNTASGKVLLVDNELHRSTLAHRIPAVAAAMGIPADEYEREIEVWPLRGNLRSLADLAGDFDEVDRGEYQIVILDAKYRFAAAGSSENDNSAETQLYNLLDRCAERTGAAFVLIHHASKGGQSDKRVTDVGAGAGAQSRAADCHLILREHEEEGIVVLDAAVRSFAPVEPLALRWQFPLWLPEGGIDVAKLKGRQTRGEQRQTEKDREGIDATIQALGDGPATARQLRTKTGFGEYRQDRLLNLLTSQGKATIIEKRIGRKTHHEYCLTK